MKKDKKDVNIFESKVLNQSRKSSRLRPFSPLLTL
jgi:hypothetical protein